MGLAMNQFLLIPKLKPEFKMAQPLPVFVGIPTAKDNFTGVPETLAASLSQKDLPMLSTAAKMKSVTTIRNMAS